MFKDLKREAITWLAGFYEGEGCLHIQYKDGPTKRNRGIIKIASTDKDVLEKAISICPLFKLKEKPREQEHYKDQWTISITKADHVYAFCCMIYPFLGKRRKEKVNEFLELYSNGTIRRMALYDQGQKCEICSEPLKPYSSTKGRCRNCYERLRRRNKKALEKASSLAD